MGFVDADSHVIECDDTWEYFDPGEVEFRPKRVRLQVPATQGAMTSHAFQELWLVYGGWAGVLDETGVTLGNGNVFDPAATTLRDPSKRVADLDALGVDVQVMYGTFFISLEIENAAAEAAVKRSYNRWLADRLSDVGGRLRWTAEVPTATMERALQELEFARAHGAVAFKVHAVEHGRYLDDPYFIPLWEKAQELDMSVLVHVGRPNSQCPVQLPIGRIFPTFAPFIEHLASPMTAFYIVLISDLTKRFPRLRWVFSEAGASWTTAILQQHSRILASRNDSFALQPFPLDYVEQHNIFITCQTDEDLPYLTQRVLGENVLILGTDYAHNDLSAAPCAHQTLLARTDLPASATRKIVDDNGRKAFGLDPTFRPTDALPKTTTTLPSTHASHPDKARNHGVVGIGDRAPQPA